MRVHELAKELDIKSADIVKALGEKGIDVKAASSIDDDNIEFVKQNSRTVRRKAVEKLLKMKRKKSQSQEL